MLRRRRRKRGERERGLCEANKMFVNIHALSVCKKEGGLGLGWEGSVDVGEVGPQWWMEPSFGGLSGIEERDGHLNERKVGHHK